MRDDGIVSDEGGDDSANTGSGTDDGRAAPGGAGGSGIPAESVPIIDAGIRLGQFLKLANLLESGAEAKSVIADGEVLVNGEAELRRGRLLRDGDVVEVFGMAARVETP